MCPWCSRTYCRISGTSGEGRAAKPVLVLEALFSILVAEVGAVVHICDSFEYN